MLAQLRPDQKAAIVMQQELAAVILLAEGQQEKALAVLEGATTIEENMSFMFGPPAIVKPSHELLGEIYLEQGKYEQAIAMFEAAMKRAPKRALSLSGLAKAQHGAGQHARAEATNTLLMRIRQHADAGTN